MKTTTNRIHQDNRTAEAELKAETAKEFAPPKGGAKPWCLGLSDKKNKYFVSKIPLSEREYCNLFETCKESKINIGAFIAEAIREKRERCQFNIHQLDMARMGIRGLLRLLLQHIDSLQAVRVDDPVAAAGFGVCLLDLVESAQCRLDLWVGQAISALHPDHHKT